MQRRASPSSRRSGWHRAAGNPPRGQLARVVKIGRILAGCDVATHGLPKVVQALHIVAADRLLKPDDAAVIQRGAGTAGLPNRIAAVRVDHQCDVVPREFTQLANPIEVACRVRAPVFTDLDLHRGALGHLLGELSGIQR